MALLALLARFVLARLFYKFAANLELLFFGSLGYCVGLAARHQHLLIQKGTRVLISLWDSLMFGRVPKNHRGVFGYPPEHERIP